MSSTPNGADHTMAMDESDDFVQVDHESQQPNGHSNGDAARPQPKVISEEDKKLAVESKEQGNAAFKAGRHDEAVRLYTEAIERDPTEPSYYTNRAAASMSLKSYRSALADCKQASSLQADHPSAKTLTRLARCHFELGEVDEAIVVLRRLVGNAEAGAGGSASGHVDVSQKEREAAEVLYRTVEKTKSNLRSCETYKNTKEWSMALIALDHAQRSVSVVPHSWLLLRADVLLRKGSLEEANSVATDALRSDVNDPEANLLRARIFFAMGNTGDFDKSVAHCQRALRADPEFKEARNLMRKCRKLEKEKDEGNQAFKSGDNEGAIRLYSQVLTHAEEDLGEDPEPRGFKATILSNRAIAQQKLSKYAEAVEDCTQSLTLKPGYVKALRTRARANLAQEAYEDAVRDFKEALEEASTSGTNAEIEGLKRELRSAEIDLKRSKKKDYYKILGVAKDANSIEIKKAYKKQSLLHHPDKGGDEEKFKLCNEAFSVLSDDTKRRRYDMGADDAESDMGAGMGGFPGGGGFDMADLFGQMGGGGGFGGHPGFGGGGFGGGSFGGGSPFGGGMGGGFGGGHSHSYGRRGGPPPGFQFSGGGF